MSETETDTETKREETEISTRGKMALETEATIMYSEEVPEDQVMYVDYDRYTDTIRLNVLTDGDEFGFVRGFEIVNVDFDEEVVRLVPTEKTREEIDERAGI